MKFINAYLKGITMEIELANSYITSLEFPKKYCVIPSFLTFTQNYKSLLNILSKISFFLILFWIFIFNFLFVFFQMINYFFKILFKKRIEVTGEVYLDLSDSKYLHSIIGHRPAHAIYFNNQKKKYLPQDIISYNYYSIIKFTSLFKASLFSIVSPFYLIYKKRINHVLYTYSAFQWFLLFISLKECKIEHVWISNHYDRYAKLVDTLGIKYYLIQHGQLFFDNEKKSEISFPVFSEGLTNCSKVYMFDINSNYYFKKYISSNYKIELINSPLKIKNYKEILFNLPTILIIGLGPYVNQHHEIIKILNHKYSNKINIVYRFHPTQAKFEFKTPITLYNDDKFSIPHSDIVFTYGSSIDIEIRKLLPEAKIVKNTIELYSLIESKITQIK
jgi:hypothetical protein